MSSNSISLDSVFLILMDVTDIYTIVFLILTDVVILVKNLIYIRFIRSKPQGRKTFIGKSFYSLNT